MNASRSTYQIYPENVPKSPITVRKKRVSFQLSHLGLALSTLFALFLAIAALAPQRIVSVNPLETNARNAFSEPNAKNILGTDENGRDVLARLVYGVRPSLIMGFGATAIGVTAGALIGLLSGLGPKFVDHLLMRALDVLLAFPDLLLALVIITFWGQGLGNAIIAIGVASIPRYARVVRAQTFSIRNSGYVEAAVSLGLSRLQLITKHILPNALKPLLVLSTIGIGGKIASGATLSFLGFGAPPPAPEWGAMLSISRNYLSNAWWLTATAGLAITFTVIAITSLGRAISLRCEGR